MLDPGAVAYLVPVGPVQARWHPDGTFTFEPGSEDAWLVGDGRNLFILGRSGSLTHLLSDVAAVGHPPLRP